MATNKTIRECGEIQMVTRGFNWTISDFFMIGSRNRKTRLVSQTFSTKDSMELRWALQFLIDNNIDEPVFKIYLVSYNNVVVKFDRITFYVYHNNERLQKKVMDKKIFLTSGSYFGFRFTRRQIKSLKKLMTLETKLTIICSLSNLASTKLDFYEAPTGILEDYESLFLNKNLCDVTLVANGKEFPAHKAILIARSSVFAAMFEHEMKEKQNNRANILGIDPEILQELLRYIYIGKVEKFDKLYEDLLIAADMYAVKGLKDMCLEYMLTNINIQNSIHFLSFSDKYAVDQLKILCMNFIVKHAKDIVQTESLKSLRTLPSPLVTELFERLALTQST